MRAISVLAVIRRFEPDLGDPRKLLAQRVFVLAGAAPRGGGNRPAGRNPGPLRAVRRARVARVPEAAAIAIPGHAASGRGPLTRGIASPERFAGGHFKHRYRSIFAAALRERYRDQLAVERRLVEIDRRASAGIERIRIHQHPRRAGIVRRRQRHQERLQLGRLRLHREQHAAARRERRETRGRAVIELAEPLHDRSPHRQAIQVCPRARVLAVAPLPHLGIGGLLQPSIVVHYFDAAVIVGNRPLGRRRSRRRLARGAR